MDKKKITAAFLCGIVVIAVPMLLYLTLNSALWDAVYWCGYANIRFMRNGGIEWKIEQLGSFSTFFYPLILFAAATLVGMTREKKLMWLWLLSALVMVQVGYSVLHNYLLLGPPLSILAATGAMELYKWSSGKGWFANACRGVFIFLAASAFLLVVFELWTIAKMGRDEENYDRQWAVSEYIASHTNKDDGIFVFMADPYIYYITDRKPVTRVTFFWIELLQFTNDSEKNEYIFGPLEKSKPKYFVMNPLYYENDSSVIPIRNYLNERYTPVGDWGMYHLYERKPGSS